MKRHLFPNVEALEAKALLSHIAVGAARNHHIANAVKQVGAVVPNLAISLTTSESTYTVGQKVQMTLTATNDTHHNVTVVVGPNADVFSITQNGLTIWRSNSGPQPLRPSTRKVIHPGQSLTLTASWTPTATGTFVVHNSMAPKGPVATFNVVANATTPPVTVNPPVATDLNVTLTTNQSSYSVGQNVQMTLTATNDTSQPETVWVGPNTNIFTISQNGTVVWRSNSGPQPLTPTVAKVLDPGQSLTLTASWTASAAGTYTVSNDIVPKAPAATFTVTANQPVPPIQPPPVVSPPIDNPPGTNPPGTTPPVSSPPVTTPPTSAGLSIALATNQSSYVVGQNVQMTLTATNNGNQDVTIWIGPTTNVFSVTQNGKVVWTSDSGHQPLNPSVSKVLKPGDSWSLTTTWKATGTGTFVVSNSLDPQGPVATFSVKSNQPGTGNGGGNGGAGGGNVA